jgi:cellulose synthase/poly-beta-1,6-N-acetylglucosamine synthase-like glycosyltransferase
MLLLVGYLLIIVLMAVQSLFNLRLRLFIWGDAEYAALNRSPKEFVPPAISFTVLLPARHEEAVIGDTIEKVCQSHYPRHLLQVIVICEQGDHGTIEAVQQKLAEPGKEHVTLIVFTDGPINKPHGLNKGLQAATNDVVTIFDAEDEMHADIFQIVNTLMVQEDPDVVQSGVRLMNYASTWFSAMNVLEYFFWFKSTMYYFAWAGVVPLGGNTVFIKRHLLENLGGWDEQCLTEDADVGIRLSVEGARVRVVCDDEHVTREETPLSVHALIKQRTRWNQGFLQVLLKRDWMHYPRPAQRLLAAYLLIVPFLQAAFAVMLPVSVAMILFVKLPVWISVFTFLPLYVFALQICSDLVGLTEFLRAHQQRLSIRVLFAMTLGAFPFQWLMAYAALRAVIRHVQRRTNWEKTAHLGVHRKMQNAA